MNQSHRKWAWAICVFTRFPADSGTHSSLSSRIGILNIWWCIIITGTTFQTRMHSLQSLHTCNSHLQKRLCDIATESSWEQRNSVKQRASLFSRLVNLMITLKQWFSTGDNFPQYILQYFHYCEIELYL